MRRAPLMSTALLGAACLMGLPATSAFAADAEVAPRHVNPGEPITIFVSCDRVSGDIPSGITASSQAFTKESVQLARVMGQDETDEAAGPAYRGKAQLAPAASFSEDGPHAVERFSDWGVNGDCPGGELWTASFTVDRGEPAGPPRTGVGGSFGGPNTAAMAGGAALLLATAGGVVCWKRRADGGACSQ
ncbi:hypothetical protein [Streptomyces gobiensis]|uniref:hypothetical protein n=1 Tax=Streptomyces gobiensis TaxID=2875706 RepID=UPI001E4B7EDC|nr:hypothetical protein [Streptomyces gobiensis]UGY94448.1 hypothetical protein test1122_23750 [Streptomyces gobiensis]